MGKIRILLADDHAIVRAGLRMLLESQPDMEVVGEAGGGLQAIQMARKLHPDLVVMDISMPDLSGLEATPRIKAECPDVQVLALTMYQDERYFFRLIQAGGSGYVVKGAPPADLIAAIRSVSQGHAYLYPSLAKKMIDEYLSRAKSGEGRAAYDSLSDREREVFRLIAEGRTGKEISNLLCISLHTVERHRQNLMAKLGLHGRVALIKYAISKGLIEIEE